MNGGIAHDLDTMPVVVIGCLDLLRSSLDGEDRGLPGDALAAAETGAELTAPRMAFARRGTLVPEPALASDAPAAVITLPTRALGPKVALQADEPERRGRSRSSAPSSDRRWSPGDRRARRDPGRRHALRDGRGGGRRPLRPEGLGPCVRAERRRDTGRCASSIRK
jgi:hypothetical protein